MTTDLEALGPRGLAGSIVMPGWTIGRRLQWYAQQRESRLLPTQPNV